MKIKGNNINRQGTRINKYPTTRRELNHTCIYTSKSYCDNRKSKFKRYIKTNNLTFRKTQQKLLQKKIERETKTDNDKRNKKIFER